TLPYVDNSVNLVVAEDLAGLPMAEVMRVLAPRGVAMVGGKRTVKPWPDDIDEWHHFLHGPDNNAVARDRVVGRPRHLQWIGGPMHLRSHEHLNSVSAVVSARGRLFTILDEGPTPAVGAPPRWRLVARDAFNGVLLWKRNLGPWEGHLRLFRSGPPALARRLVAHGDAVYATLGYGKPVAAFDAATGQPLRVYEATEGAIEIVCDGERLFVLCGRIPDGSTRPFYPSPEPREKSIVVVEAATGKLLWRREDQHTQAVMPTTLAVSGGRVFFHNTRQVVCLDARTGRERWRADRPAWTTRLSWSAPTLVVADGVVLSADGPTGALPKDAGRGADTVTWLLSDRDIRKHPKGDLVAFSAETGERLWRAESLQGFCSPADVFVVDGLVWPVGNVAPRQQTMDVALDLATGEVRRRRTVKPPPAGGHARCYRNKATERFLVLGGSGVEIMRLDDWSWTADRWVRGTCQYGVMPCNGLLYVPPDSCACQPHARLHGFTALAPRGRFQVPGAGFQDDRLERGPTYETDPRPGTGNPEPSSWPTYRCDAARSGATKAAVPARVEPAWQAELGGRLSAPVVAGARVYVAARDAHTLHALSADDGSRAWQFTAGGRIDSPPTIVGGRVLFGCRDGWVYCLRARDGALAWRFRAAPADRRLVAHGRVESVWPVHGSVLVRDGLAWFAAGRSAYLDGGLRLYALELTSGEVEVERRFEANDLRSSSSPKAKGRGRVPGMLPDILSASDSLVFMRWTCFDEQGKLTGAREPHLFSSTGFLDDTWWHRTYWQYGTWMRGGFGGWPRAARRRPAGRILVEAEDAIFGFGRSQYDVGNPKGVHAGHVGLVKDGYQDMGRIDDDQNPYRLFAAAKPAGRRRKEAAIAYRWRTQVPLLVRAMVLADETLFIAGPKTRRHHRSLAALGSPQPGLLWAVSASEGTKLAECELPADPVLDGMAAAAGRLYLTTTDGSVVCLRGK
ncbi:MAG: PQQ-binding-like beta-propeller repeat protein, partial [Planctomycetota bacterium]